MQLFSTEHWKQARASYMEAARGCRDTLTNPAGHWGYELNDPRVKYAVGVWVDKARDAHAIALNRRPVIENAVVIHDGNFTSGSLYATPRHRVNPLGFRTNPATLQASGVKL